MAFVNFAILLVSCQKLGSDIRGQVSLLIFNIAIVQIVNEIYTGYILVYFIPKFSLKKIYAFGILWAFICTLLCISVMAILFFAFEFGSGNHWLHLVLLSLVIIIHSFHMVILLAKERIKMYNFLNFFQPALLLLVLLIMFFVFDLKSINTYIIALYISFSASIIISIIQVVNIFRQMDNHLVLFEPKRIIENGFYNQLANLCHMLSNRYNFYLLGNTILIGVYSSATSLIESVWIISGSVSPIILTYIANEKDPSNNAKLTLLLAKICFLLSLVCVIVLYFIPRDFFVFLLGEDFIHVKTVMLYLSPGILFISFATIISHYFAGLGKQKILLTANSFGLLTTICVSPFLIRNDQLLGACYSASLSYLVATAILVFFFIKENRFSVLDLLRFKKDFDLLRKS